MASPPTVDIHTHIYTPSFIELLRSRTTVPYIRHFPSLDPPDRLIILPAEAEAAASSSDPDSHPSTSTSTSTTATHGRPLTTDFTSLTHKLAFMDAHGISISVLSLANPWLDFLPASTAAPFAHSLNTELDALCAEHPGRLFAFGTLPLSAGADASAAELQHLQTLPHMRGAIIGTSGLGAGLDDPQLDKVYAVLQDTQSVVFIHPHYGLPGEVYGPRQGEYGHVLPLALGFPLETTIAVARMYLSGVWDRFPRLKVLLAHSGGTLPFLAGRIESCIRHDALLREWAESASRRDLWEVLRTNVYLDAVIYSQAGLRAAVDVAGEGRLMFGTDHPFFPPLEKGETEWLSARLNSTAIADAYPAQKAAAIMGGNAVEILNLRT